MKNAMKLVIGIAGLFYVLSSEAGALTVPNSFSAGTPAVAAQVNGNFNAVKAAVDDNDSRINANQSNITSMLSGAPAVKQKVGSVWTTMPTTAGTNIDSITVTPSADGFVVVTASGGVNYNFTSGGGDGFICVALSDVNNDTGACVPNSSTGLAVRSTIPSASPTTGSNGIGVPYNIVKVYPVNAGITSTYYLNGYATGFDSAYLFHQTLTALYVPAALP